MTNAIGSLCPHSAHAVTHYSSQALGDFICVTNRSCQTHHLARSLDAALFAAYKFYHVDFLDPDGHKRNAKDSAFVRDWFCLRTSHSGGGFRPYLQRFNFLNSINNVMPRMIDRTDFILNSTPLQLQRAICRARNWPRSPPSRQNSCSRSPKEATRNIS